MEVEEQGDYGGDEETTHMVKGLDFALLAKAKMKILKEERENEEKQREEDAHQAAEKGNQVLSRDGVQMEQPRQFESRMGKTLYNTIFVKQREPVVHHFLPGRTTYLYELDPDSYQDLPTTVHRSRESDQSSQLELAVTHPEILSRITKIMVYYTQGAAAYKKLKKKQKKEEQEKKEAQMQVVSNKGKPAVPVAKPQVPIEDEEDIFDVEGAYVPSANANASNVKAYSAYVTALAPVSNPLGQIQESRDRSIREFQKNLEQQQKTAPTDHGEKEPSFVSDVYAECYPESFEGGGMRTEIGSDDEEDDFTKMDSRNRLRRWDFETDEQYEDYESKREATPKAAFQFGVKTKDGRKPQKKIDNKLNQQLKQIEGMYEEKTGKKFAKDEDDDVAEKPKVDPNSYEHKLMQKRVRAMTTNEEGIFNFNKKPKLNNNSDVMAGSGFVEPKTPQRAAVPQTPQRMVEPRTPSRHNLTEPRTPGSASFNPKMFK